MDHEEPIYTLTEQFSLDIELQYIVESLFLNEASTLTDSQKLENFVGFIKKWTKYTLKGVSLDSNKKKIVLKAKTKDEAEKFKEYFYKNNYAKANFDVNKIEADGTIHIKIKHDKQ